MKPMPDSKKKELVARVLMTNALNNKISDVECYVDPKCKEDPEESGNEDQDEIPDDYGDEQETDNDDEEEEDTVNVPESINVDDIEESPDDIEERPEGSAIGDSADALDGVDLFKDIYIDPDAIDDSNVIEEYR